MFVVPPPRASSPTATNIATLARWLDGILAFRAGGAHAPWQFYEELDAYLGPWHERGYLIGYGKKYCAEFFGARALRREPLLRQWMERTLLLLQKELRDFVLERYARGQLAMLAEHELRRFAFASHWRAYHRAGFLPVAFAQPRLIGEVLSIVGAEWVSPRATSGSAGSSAPSAASCLSSPT